MSVHFDFTGRVVLISGGGRGIGAALSRAFVNAGATVAIVDLSLHNLDSDLAQARNVRMFAGDVASAGDVIRIVDAVVTEFGALDVLVNNAGITRDTVVWKMSDQQWADVLAVHLTGSFNLSRAAIPHMRARSYGRILNVTSYTGLHGNVGQANYAAAKAGLIGFTKTVAKEVARFGITVNAISPNAATDMVTAIPAEKLAELTRAVPQGRFAEPAEMAAAVQFLASEQAGYITGVVLPVDGGLSM
ncbi:3-oxoacyl-[acyl-carrier-protein] reductase [Sporichthya brevicatena]|uniref:3-oxoacyl-[acyl-carrier-protein] reductase n=1 Tax=Sporichthya brevicatena TaxID=171442 RepID=A0ABN1G4X1_9ACTN